MSAVSAVIRSSDLSQGQTNHSAINPKTTKEKNVWTPNTVKASTAASLPESQLSRPRGSNPEPVVYKTQRDHARTGTDAHLRRKSA